MCVRRLHATQKGLLSPHRPVYVRFRHLFLLGERVCQNRGFSTVEEIKNAVVHMAFPGPELMDTVPQDI